MSLLMVRKSAPAKAADAQDANGDEVIAQKKKKEYLKTNPPLPKQKKRKSMKSRSAEMWGIFSRIMRCFRI